MKYLKYLLFVFGVLIILSTILQYVINTKYIFPEPLGFRGERLYNPYNRINSTNWKRANFHFHTRIFHGLTAGASVSNQIADQYYKFFNYDIHEASDYMSINTYHIGNSSYIPEYEHGYSYYKTHQLVFNAKKVCYIDFLFHQTVNNKQFIINKLKEDTTALVAIVHPSRRNAFNINDFKYLGNYDFIEIANNHSNYSAYYDTALSSGHVVFLLADDDAHSLSDIADAAHSFNLINTDSEKNSILHALKVGKSYGVMINTANCKTNFEKQKAIENVPVLTKFDIKNDTIYLKLSRKADTIKFVGQNSKLEEFCTNCSEASYYFKWEDTYIRTEILCTDGSLCYLNPVFRYDGHNLPTKHPIVDVFKTWSFRIIFSAMAIVVLSLLLSSLSNKTKN